MNSLEKLLKKQNGISSLDCVVAIIIISVMFGVIITIYNNIIFNQKSINRRAEATRIMINIAENIDAIYYSTFENQYNSLEKNDFNEHYLVGNDNIEIFNTQIPSGYTIFLKNEEDDEKFKVKISVEYSINGVKKEIYLTKFINKEGT